jgi:hypothetical protein
LRRSRQRCVTYDYFQVGYGRVRRKIQLFCDLRARGIRGLDHRNGSVGSISQIEVLLSSVVDELSEIAPPSRAM